MNADEIIRTLNIIKKTYSRILDDSQNIVIPVAIASVRASKEEYDRTKRNSSRGIEIKSWGYTIDDQNPLRFVSSKVKDMDIQVDVYCDIRWTEDPIPVTQEIKVRLWSQHNATIFDPDRDASAIMDKLSDPTRSVPGRVVSRFHFDRANPKQQGPMYHLQIGGNPKEYELCWHPSSVNVPRLQYHPMELFLTCQLIAANFFWDDYLEIRQKGEWVGELISWQEHILLNHYKRCFDTIQQKKSLLDNLWVN